MLNKNVKDLNKLLLFFLFPENYSEELLEVHERELQKMQEYYKAHQQVLDLMVKRDKLWNEMLEFEVCNCFFFCFFGAEFLPSLKGQGWGSTLIESKQFS